MGILDPKTRVKISGIYAIKNTVNGRIYIGSSQEIRGRWRTHLYQLIQLTLEGNQVGNYFGANEAAQITGLSPGGIRQSALGNKKTCGGFVWKYVK